MQRLLKSTTALLLALPATGWSQQTVDAGEIKFDGWDYSPLYEESSWSVIDMFNQPAVGSDGDEIGDVEDLVFSSDGQLIALIAEVGGFWDIGDTHVSIPWEEIGDRGIGPVVIPVTEDSIGQYDIFDSSGLPGTELADDVIANVDDADFASGIWRASDLIGDYARILSEDKAWMNFGYVTDIVVKDGEIAAIVVRARASATGNTYGTTYAYPPAVGRGAAEAPGTRAMGRPTYDMPILMGDAIDLPSFERDRVGTM